MSKTEYFYKANKTNKRVYMQIWKRVNGKETFIRSLGTAEKLVGELSAANLLSDQTKKSDQKRRKKKFQSDQKMKKGPKGRIPV